MAIIGQDLKLALMYGSMMPLRWALALGSTIYCVFTLFGPDASGSLVLASGWRCGWAAVFGLNAFCQWWRIFDAQSRRWWALFTNLLTVCLWGGILVGTALASNYLSPGLTGYIILELMAVLVFFRTEFTPRDKDTA